MNRNTLRIIYASVALLLGLVLPLLTAGSANLDTALCLSHIPVMLCGFLCGWPWGLVVGAAVPVLRHFLFASPPVPDCWVTAAELAVYGLVCGLLYRKLPKKAGYYVIVLITAMAAGRAAAGLTAFIIDTFRNRAFSFSAFMGSAVTKTVPGMAVQLVLIPLAVEALRRAKLVPNGSGDRRTVSRKGKAAKKRS